MRILLAEDNVVNQRLALLMLERLGQDADVVSNGTEAVNAAARLPYDIILMDVQMPEMDGLTATHRIRQTVPPDRQPRIIAMTANVLAGDRERCIDAGMNDYVGKPISLEELTDALERNRPQVGVEHLSFDPSAIERLAQSVGAQGTARVLTSLITDAPRLLLELGRSIQESDEHAYRRCVHSLKSNAMMVGALELGGRLQELESRGFDSHLQRAADGAGDAQRDYEALMQTIRTLRDRYAA